MTSTTRRRLMWWTAASALLVGAAALTVYVHPGWFIGFCAVVGVLLRAATRNHVGVEDDPGYGPDDWTRRSSIIPPGLWPPP